MLAPPSAQGTLRHRGHPLNFYGILQRMSYQFWAASTKSAFPCPPDFEQQATNEWSKTMPTHNGLPDYVIQSGITAKRNQNTLFPGGRVGSTDLEVEWGGRGETEGIRAKFEAVS